MEPVHVCPSCGERAVPAPPRSLAGRAAHGQPAPGWSHLDREPLCPVVGPGGYRPADPVRVVRFGPELAGTWLTGSGLRTDDELNAETAAFAAAHGMPLDDDDRAALAAWAAVLPAPWGDRCADEELSDYLWDLACDAVAWLDTVTDGASWDLDDGLHLALPDDHDTDDEHGWAQAA